MPEISWFFGIVREWVPLGVERVSCIEGVRCLSRRVTSIKRWAITSTNSWDCGAGRHERNEYRHLPRSGLLEQPLAADGVHGAAELGR